MARDQSRFDGPLGKATHWRCPIPTTSFRNLAALFDELESMSSSNAMINALARFLPTLSPQEVRMTAYLLAGRIGPSFRAPEIGIGQTLAIRALAEAGGQTREHIKKLVARSGDVGSVAETLIIRRADRLTITKVFDDLAAIAHATGRGAQHTKVMRLAALLRQASGLEAKYITRAALGTHRIGVGELTFLSALGRAFGGKGTGRAALDHAYNILSDLGDVAYRAARYGLASLKRVKPDPGIPVRMMLATRVEDLDEVPLHVSGEMFVEYKYDGERVQFHRNTRGELRAFSRRLEDITHQYPEVCAALHTALKARSAIIEGEVVAVDLRTNKLQPFQRLMRRKRKHDVSRYQREIPVALFLFDLLMLNGKSLLTKPLVERKELLRRHINADRTIKIGTFIRTADMIEAEKYFYEAIRQGAEGVVIKGAASPYQAGHRGWRWIKFKKEYEKELADTFDVVIVGALYGKGARAGTFGSVLAAAFDPASNRYYSFTKVGAGLTDALLRRLPSLLGPHQIPARHRLVDASMKMDVWFEPAKVIEIMGADLTISPVHCVAHDKLKTGGIALRFPRFLRFRDDKSPEQATTVREIWQMYQSRMHTHQAGTSSRRESSTLKVRT
jgi:DNA ligase-1